MLSRRVQTIYPSPERAEQLMAEKKLSFYFGIDPTGKDVHLGHVVPLLVLRELAEKGHTIVLLIGDFTARIGDPTDKSATRVALSPEEIETNMAGYIDQVAKVLPRDMFEVRYNSEWLARLTMEEVVRLASRVTVQQMLARDMFQERLKEEKPIHVSEFLYPLMQGYDSVALQTDGEVGGNDQTFNMLVGRELEKEILGKDKIVIATKLLIDAGGKKMSKSEGSLIAINDSPQEIRRKVLAMDDAMIPGVFQLCTNIESLSKDARESKEQLAAELIRMFHGEGAIGEARQALGMPAGPLDQALKASGAATTASAAHRLIDEGGVKVNDQTVTEWKHGLQKGDRVQVGKGKFYEVN